MARENKRKIYVWGKKVVPEDFVDLLRRYSQRYQVPFTLEFPDGTIMQHHPDPPQSTRTEE